ncbi:MAG: PilN domain-containing protein [Nitrospirae bacterium]|nr:PilN domain-containing protein [Nitrospirota bacterium]
MIKINLSTIKKGVKKSKKKIEFQSQLIAAVALIVITAGGVGYGWMLLNSKVSRLENEKVLANKELNSLKEKVKVVENYEKDKKNFEEKISVIEQLKKNQTGPVIMLDEISKNIPERVWLTKITESGGKINMEGNAISNTDLASFINNLKNTKGFSNVELTESKGAAEANIPIYIFKMQCDFKVVMGAE